MNQHGYDFTKELQCSIKESIPVEFYEYRDGSWQLGNIKLTVATWNIWGVEHFKHYSLLDRRLPHINRILKELDTDLICLQEVSQTALDSWILKQDWIREKYYISSIDAPWISDKVNDIGGGVFDEPNVWCYLLTKQIPVRSKTYVLDGNGIYFNCMAVDLGNLLVVVTHLQSGGILSGFPEEVAMQYHTCRQEQFARLKDLLDKDFGSDDILYIGDFNCDLDGDPGDWPEVLGIKDGLMDVWKEINPGTLGATEDTYKNTMRYNIKEHHKKYRYDGMLYTGNRLKPVSMRLFGDQPVFELSREEFESIAKKEPAVLNKNNMIDWYPSDHFGLYAEFTIIKSVPVKPFVS